MASDLFGPGALLLNLITGQRPSDEWIAQAPDIHVDGFQLRSIIAKGMHRDPTQRFQTAQEFIDALRPFSSLDPTY